MVVEEKRRDADIAERVKPVRVTLAPETGVQAKEVLDVDNTESATKAQRVKIGDDCDYHRDRDRDRPEILVTNVF
jgi:hypothetical protein